MNAANINERQMAAPAFGRFAGLGALVRKDVTEWMRGRRTWIVFAITTAFMILSVANAWLTVKIRALAPPDVQIPDVPVSLAPLDNLLAGVSSQVFVLATILAVASLLVRERESGTLAWIASKPVSRSSIWVSKWLSACGMLTVSAVIAPVALTTAIVVALYGTPDPVAVAMISLGATASVVFFAALGLAAGTVMPGQPAIAATGFMVFILAPVIAGIVPLPIGPFLPTSMLQWAASAAMGADVGVVTPIAWLAFTGGLVAVAIRQMGRMEL